MTQDEKWQARYEEIVEFINKNHRNPSKYDEVERGLYCTWLKHNRKQMNAGTMKPERVIAFKELLTLSEQYRRKNQYDQRNEMSMERNKEFAPCQGYRGYADMEAVEYKYPKQRPVKYVLRITLTGSSPRVWREIAVPSTIKLTSLAHVIILAMGWEESHLSLFKKGRKEYHVYMDGADTYDYPIEDASAYVLCDLLGAGEEMTFLYDFGDNWKHTVKVVESSEYGKDEKPQIRLIDGKNACPPNDVGGISGYKEMLRTIKENPDGDEAWEYYTWLGSRWDENFFPAIDTAIALNELNHR